MNITSTLDERGGYAAIRAAGLSIVAITGLMPAGSRAEPWRLHSSVGAPQNLKLSGAMRARYEALEGQPRAGLDANDDLVSLRTSLLAEYSAGSLRVGGELQDSRAYLGEPGSAVSTVEVNALELIQAYVAADFKDVFGAKSSASLQAGRLTLNVGSRRLVAADDYRNTASGYTGARADVKTASGWAATLLYALPQQRLPDDQPSLLDNDIEFDRESSDLVLWGGSVTTPKFAGGAALDAVYFRLNERDSADLATRNRRLDTAALRFFRDPAAEHIDFEFEASGQRGSILASTARTAPELDVSAYFVHAEAGYQWQHRWQPRVSVEYDLVSGDGPGQDYGRYDTLFGMRRPDFAPSGIYAAVGRANIRSPGIRIEVMPGPRLEGFVGYRALWLDSPTDSFSTSAVRDPTGASGDFAGHQLDSRLRYWLVPQSLRFEADVVLLKKGRFLRDAPNAPATGDTHFVSLNVTAIF